MGDDAAEQQAALQTEGAVVLDDLNLRPILAKWGIPHLIGSMAMGLMVSRDIDFNVVVECADATILAIAHAALLPITVHPRVFRLRFASQIGPFNLDGSTVEEGFYYGIHYQTAVGDDWKIDVWTVQPPRPEIAQAERVRAALDTEMRAAILAIKREMKANSSFRANGIHSRHVYDAALAGVRDMQHFERWLAEQGLLADRQQ